MLLDVYVKLIRCSFPSSLASVNTGVSRNFGETVSYHEQRGRLVPRGRALGGCTGGSACPPPSLADHGKPVLRVLNKTYHWVHYSCRQTLFIIFWLKKLGNEVQNVPAQKGWGVPVAEVSSWRCSLISNGDFCSEVECQRTALCKRDSCFDGSTQDSLSCVFSTSRLELQSMSRLKNWEN